MFRNRKDPLTSFGPRLCLCSGWALPVALWLLTFSSIALLVFLERQRITSRRAEAAASEVQTVLTARSGIADGISRFIGYRDRRLALSLGNGLFTSLDSLPAAVLCKGLVGGPFPVAIPDPGLAGVCSLSTSIDGCYIRILSNAQLRGHRRAQEALLGSMPLGGIGDTVLFVRKTRWTPPPAPNNPITGFIACLTDSFPAPALEPCSAMVACFTRSLQDSILLYDTVKRGAPLLIKSDEECAKIPDTVDRDLFFDGREHELSWTAPRSIYVKGDLQLLGNTRFSGIHFFLSGEGKLFGKSIISDLTIVAGKRIFFGEEASSCRITFQGTAIAFGAIEICRNTIIQNPSIIMHPNSKADSGMVRYLDKRGKIPQNYAIYIRDSTRVSGSIINFSRISGVHIYPKSSIEGAVFAGPILLHEGTLSGVAIADGFRAGSACTIKPDPEVRRSILPFFMGEPALLYFREAF